MALLLGSSCPADADPQCSHRPRPMPDIDVAVAEQNSTIAVYPHHDEALNAWKPLGDGGFASNHVSMVGKGAKRQRSLPGAHHFAPENCHHRAQGDSSYSSGLRRANDLTGGAREMVNTSPSRSVGCSAADAATITPQGVDRFLTSTTNHWPPPRSTSTYHSNSGQPRYCDCLPCRRRDIRWATITVPLPPSCPCSNDRNARSVRRLYWVGGSWRSTMRCAWAWVVSSAS